MWVTRQSCLLFFGILIGVSLLNCRPFAAGVEITKPPKNTVIKDGTDAGLLMLCTISPDTKHLTWKKGKDEICDSKDTATPCDDATTYVLDATKKYNLNSAKDIDSTYAGKYTCTVEDVTEPVPGELVIVEKKPVCLPNAKVLKGVETPLELCTLVYHGTYFKELELKLRKNGATEDESMTTKDDDTNKKLIGKVNVTLDATAKYTCSLKHDTITDVQEVCTVDAVDRVIEFKPQEFTFQKEGERTQLNCTTTDTASGYGSVKWTFKVSGSDSAAKDACTGHEGEDPKPTCEKDFDPLLKMDTPAKHDLTILKLDDKTAGAYTCVVSTLEFYSAEVISVKKPDCSRDKDNILTCKVPYVGIKGPTVKWMKGGNEVTSETKSDEGGTKTVTAKMEDTETDHFCEVYNEDEDKLYSCEVSSASAIIARLYQSTLLAVLTLWLSYQLK